MIGYWSTYTCHKPKGRILTVSIQTVIIKLVNTKITKMGGDL